jgi:hypothetical protein
LKNSSRRDKDPFLLFSVKRNPEKLKVKKLASSLELKYGEEANYLPSIF